MDLGPIVVLIPSHFQWQKLSFIALFNQSSKSWKYVERYFHRPYAQNFLPGSDFYKHGLDHLITLSSKLVCDPGVKFLVQNIHSLILTVSPTLCENSGKLVTFMYRMRMIMLPIEKSWYRDWDEAVYRICKINITWLILLLLFRRPNMFL